MVPAANLALQPGDLLGVLLPPGPGWPDVVAHCLERGAAILPVDHRLPGPEIRRLLDLAEPTHVLDDDGLTVHAEARPVGRHVALVVPTSGTGGTPKAVELSRPAVEAAVRGSAEVLGLAGDEPWVCCLPPGHIGGLLVLLRAVLAGADVTIHPRFDTDLVGRAPEGSWISAVPTMLARMLEAGVDLRRFGGVLVGGARLDRGLGRRAADAGARVVETYGLTESCGGVVYDGRPFPGTEVRVGSSAGARPGEVLLKGPTVMEGYRHDPQATRAAFAPGGWLRTGDLGSFGEDGRLSIDGRADDLILTGGEKVWPPEVEAALRTHPSVADVAVAGRPDPEWGQRVVAFVVPEPDAPPPRLEDLRDHAAATLPRFKAPRELIFVETLPRTPSGKMRRGLLPA